MTIFEFIIFVFAAGSLIGNIFKDNEKDTTVENWIYVVSTTYVVWYLWDILVVLTMYVVYIIKPMFEIIYNFVS